MNMNNMFGSKMMNNFFRPVDNTLWDLMTGSIGVMTTEGIVSMVDGDVTINPIEQFGMPVPAFAQSTPIASVNTGDLIYKGNKPLGWVIETPTDDKPDFQLMKLDGTYGGWKAPKVKMFGMDSGVLVLRSLLNMVPGSDGGTSGLANMQSMLLPLMMMGGDGDMDLGGIMPMVLMSQMGGSVTTADGTDASNPMSGMASMLPMMIMMKAMGGNKGGGMFNGAGNFFDK